MPLFRYFIDLYTLLQDRCISTIVALCWRDAFQTAVLVLMVKGLNWRGLARDFTPPQTRRSTNAYAGTRRSPRQFAPVNASY